MIMKNQLLNLKMIALMCLMMVLGGANVWAQKAQTLFLETFGSTTSTPAYNEYSGFTATKDMFTQGTVKENYSGDGKVGKSTYAAVNLSSGYDGASGKSGCFNQGKANQQSTIIKISNIKIKDYRNLKLSFGALGNSSSHKVDVSYIIDNGTEQKLSTKGLSNTKWTLCSYDIPSTGNSLTLVITHTPSKSWTIRLDDIKVTGVKSAAEPTYTPATVNFVAHAGADYYATFSNANVVFMPKDVTISAVTVDNNNVVMWKSTEGVLGTEETVNIEGTDVAGYYIPANTGVLLNSQKGGEVTYYTVENKEVAAYSADLDNMLMPSVAGGEFTADADKVYYKLAYNDYKAQTGLGFYWGAIDGGAFYVKAGTAYLAVPKAKAAGAKGFTLNGEATGIEGVNANVENAKAIYNLNGQRVASMAKPGLYIVNGKKVVRK